MNRIDSTSANQRSCQIILAAIILIVVAAFVLRAVAAVVVERYVQNTGRSFLVEGDANGYWELASKIAAGKEYAIHQPPRYVLRTPGFPLLLAGCIKTFGNSVLPARFVLAIIGTVNCWLAFLLGRKLMGPWVGLLAAGILAVHPLQIASSVLILSENLFTFWMLLSLIGFAGLLMRFCDTKLGSEQPEAPANVASSSSDVRRMIRMFFVGGLIGVAVLVRPGFLPWLGFCIPGILLCRRQALKARIAYCFVLVSGCFCVLLPWAIRNHNVTGHYVLTSLWSGPSLYDGLNPKATGASDMIFFDEERVMDRMTEFEMNRHYSQRAFRFAVSHPGRIIELGVRKAALYLAIVPNFSKDKGLAVQAGCALFWVLIMLGSAVGLTRLLRSGRCPRAEVDTIVASRWLVMLFTTGPFSLFLLIHLVFVGSVRYRLPVEFPLAVLASFGWISVWRFISRHDVASTNQQST